MPTPETGATFAVIFQIRVEPDRGEKLAGALSAEYEHWVRFLPGFVSAKVHVSLDGRNIIDVVTWLTAEDWQNFSRHPKRDRFRAILTKGRAGDHGGLVCRLLHSVEMPPHERGAQKELTSSPA